MNNTCVSSVTEKQAFYAVNSESTSSHANSQGLSGQKYVNDVSGQMDPLNLDAEENILGGLLLDPQAMRRVVDILEPRDFFVVSHQLIYKRIQELYEHKRVTDFLSVKSYLEDKKELEKVGGLAKLTQLANRVVSTVQIDKHAELVIQKSVQRQIKYLGYEIADYAQNYQPDYYGESSEIGDSNSALQEAALFLAKIEKRVHQVTRSRYRFDLRQDEETRTADFILNKIKHIENTVSNLVHKRYKLMALAKQYKMTQRELEGLYIASLIQKENTPIETLASLREKYGDNVDEWFVQGILPKGVVTLLHSLGGVGKTRLAYDLIYSMVTGTSWGNQFPVTAPTRRCLIVQTDESRNDMIRSLNSRGFTDEMPVFVKTNWSFEHLPDLRREIVENQIEMVFIDSLTTVNKNSIVSENDTEYARPILQLRDLAEELNVAIVLNHHSNSGGKSRGTKAIYNSVSQVLCLKFPSEGSKSSCPNRLLMFEKTRLRRPTEYKLAFNMNEETGQWSWTCEGENIQRNDQEENIIDIIVNFLAENRNKCFTAQEIASFCKLAVNTVRKILFKLAELDKLVGRVESNRKGKPWLHFLKWELESSSPEEDTSKQEQINVESPPTEQNESPPPENTFELERVGAKLEDKDQLPDPPDIGDIGDLKGVDQVEAYQEEDSTLPDPHSPKIEEVSEEIEEEKCRSEIRKNSVTPETIVKSTIEPDTLPNPSPNTLPDHQEKEQKEGSGKRSDETSLRYVGTDIELARLCALSGGFKILREFDGEGMCFIWSDNWNQPRKVFWGDLAKSLDT